MPDTNFSAGTVVTSTWLNEINDFVFTTFPAFVNTFNSFVTSLASTTGATLVGYKNAAASAVLRTVSSILDETVSVKSFGAVGDGATDDSLAFANALLHVGTTKQKLFIPAGVYLIPSATLSIPTKVIVYGEGASTVLRRTTNTAVPLLLGNMVTDAHVRDLALESTAGWSSTSSVAIGTGSKTFTVPEGLPLIPGDSIIVRSNAAKQNNMIGTVASYTGPTLILNITSSGGSGTFTDWLLDRNDGENIALRFLASSQCSAENVQVSGRFYVGIGAQNSSKILFNKNLVIGPINRGIYGYATSGTMEALVITNNVISADSTTDYGINLNGSGGTLLRAIVINNNISSTLYQGIGVGGSCQEVAVSFNKISGVSATSGVGILIQRANGVSTSRSTVSENTVNAAPNAIFVLDSTYTSVSNNTLTSGVYGIRVEQSVVESTNQFTTVTGNIISSFTTAGIYYAAVTAGFCSFQNCVGNNVTNCGTGFQSLATTDRIVFTSNLSFFNTTSYNILGTNHVLAGNL